MGCLSGIKVLELGQLIAGPFTGKTLADFGADVIKVETPVTGDALRKWRLLKNGTSVWWQVQSRNKKSLSLDLKTVEAQDIIRNSVFFTCLVCGPTWLCECIHYTFSRK